MLPVYWYKNWTIAYSQPHQLKWNCHKRPRQDRSPRSPPVCAIATEQPHLPKYVKAIYLCLSAIIINTSGWKWGLLAGRRLLGKFHFNDSFSPPKPSLALIRGGEAPFVCLVRVTRGAIAVQKYRQSLYKITNICKSR